MLPGEAVQLALPGFFLLIVALAVHRNALINFDGNQHDMAETFDILITRAST